MTTTLARGGTQASLSTAAKTYASSMISVRPASAKATCNCVPRWQRADELMETGDMDGRAVWLRIVKAIEELLAKERPEGEKVH